MDERIRAALDIRFPKGWEVVSERRDQYIPEIRVWTLKVVDGWQDCTAEVSEGDDNNAPMLDIGMDTYTLVYDMYRYIWSRGASSTSNTRLGRAQDKDYERG